VHERDDRPPDLADRTNGDFVRRDFSQNLKAGFVWRRDQIVKTKTKLRLSPRQAIGNRPDGKQRAHERRLSEVQSAHHFPRAVRIHRHFRGVDFRHRGIGNEPVEDIHDVLRSFAATLGPLRRASSRSKRRYINRSPEIIHVCSE
jgi:hypothetical protein